MERAFNVWQTSRELYLNLMNEHSLEQLNKIPEGFNNNLIWNIGHIIVAQQGLVYKGSNLEGQLPKEMAQLYIPGSKPTTSVSAGDIKEIKELLMSLLDTTKADYNNGLFVDYNKRMTGTGFYVGSVEDAIEFNNYHEAIHLGVMMTMRKFL